ncbi:hypothetical protein HD712_02535 [Clostridium gasigenes]|uniref:hypothetical protein n=2 Tax=Clostridium gasigenes TaxID=94869 RepID=UPI00143868AE|nr:hypothetical protein [Clostridium gasigenes]NKF05732.1 hypothetical protein [Clostridium gasigenes]
MYGINYTVVKIFSQTSEYCKMAFVEFYKFRRSTHQTSFYTVKALTGLKIGYEKAYIKICYNSTIKENRGAK